MPGRQRNSRRRRLYGGVFAPVLLLAPVSVVAQTSGPNAPTDRIDDDRRLCLSQLGESPLPADFEFIGLSASEEVGTDPVITMWSRSDVLVEKLSSDAVTGTVARIPLTNVTPLSAALVAWDERAPIVELFDPRNRTIWTVTGTDGELARTATPPGAVAASGAIRAGSGWVWAQKTLDPVADTSSILISAVGRLDASHQPITPLLLDEPQRGIDRLLHLRPAGNGGYLVQQAGFPFETIRFTDAGDETWRIRPAPEELRAALGETDLLYVIATPALDLSDAVLTTFVAVRSGRRIASLTAGRGKSIRYRPIPDGLAFLAVLPRHELLIGVRTTSYSRLVFLHWRWIDQHQRC